MENKSIKELSDELMSKVSGGTFSSTDKELLNAIAKMYRKDYPDASLDDFINYLIQVNSVGPKAHKFTEAEIKEAREYVAHYWE